MTSRRRFLASCAFVAGAPVVNALRKSQTRALLTRKPEVRVNVRDVGARGDGRTDDTDAFARAVAQTAGGGGTVEVPAGRYRIDPLRGIRPADRSTLEMADDAVLEAIPVESGSSAVIHLVGAKNVAVRGGTIIGERDEHLGTSGEWGMGIQVAGGSDVLLESIRIERCWGDGIYVGGQFHTEASKVTIRHCRVTNNRRQGLSITACVNSLIEDCEFSNTHGAAPQAGIDIEPNGRFVVQDVIIRRCFVFGNHGYGIVLSGGKQHHVYRVSLHSNRATANGFHGIGVVNAIGAIVRNNIVELNGRDGLQIAGSTQTLVTSNTIRDNSRRTPDVWDNVMIQSRASDNVLIDNQFESAAGVASRVGPRFDIRIEASCERNRLTNNHLRQRTGSARHPAGGVLDRGKDTVIRDS